MLRTQSAITLVAFLFSSSPALAAPKAAARSKAPTASATTVEPTVKPLSESLSGDARTSYEAAKLLYADRDFSGASAKFRQAYETAKDPRLLWNMAACEKEQRHYAKATTLVEHYVREMGPRLSDESRRSAEELVDSLKSFSSPVVFVNLPAGATIQVDDVAIGTAPLGEQLHLDLGAHVIKVLVEGSKPFEKRIDVPGGSSVSVDVQLEAAPQSARLAIKSSAPTDSILIDEKFVGQGRWEGPLAAGQHRVRVTGDGKKSYDQSIQLEAQKNRSLEVTLVDDGKPLWPWIAGGSAVAVGLGVAAFFVFGNSQPAEGPGGSLGDIVIR